MVKESAGRLEQGKGNSSLLSKDRPEWGWKWKVGIVGLDVLKWREVESWLEVREKYMPQGQGHVINCLLCDFNKEPLPRVPRASVSTQSPGHGENAVPLLCCFVFSEVQQPTDRTTSPCFWFPAYSRQEDQKSSWKVLPGEKHESISYEIIRNTRCEGAEDCKIIFLFYPVLCNRKSSLDSWGRGKAGEPVGETESNKKKLLIWNLTTLSCRLKLSFEVSLLELGSVSYAIPDEKEN